MKYGHFLILVLVLLAFCPSCVDPDFDLDNVKLEGRVFVNMEVPIGSFETVTLETILKAPGAAVTPALMPGKYHLTGWAELSGLSFRFGDDLFCKEAELHTVARNTLPMDLTLSVVAIDAEGNTIPDVSVTIQAEGTPMIASGLPERPSENPLVFRFTCTNRYMTMDGLRLVFSGETGAGFENQAPHTDEGIQLTQVYLKVPEGLIVGK